jgi:predicted HTH transcriptional regulator
MRSIRKAKKLEMARDVSAFANADGGQIVYGMKENKDHEPEGLDVGLDPREYPESGLSRFSNSTSRRC